MHGVNPNPGLRNFKGKGLLKLLKAARQWNGEPLPACCFLSIKRSWHQYSLLTKQIKELEQRQRKILRETHEEPAKATDTARKAATLSRLLWRG